MLADLFGIICGADSTYSSLGIVVVRHCGYTAVVKVGAETKGYNGHFLYQLFISLRMLLHKSSTPSPSGGKDMQSAKVLVKKVLEESVTKMEEEDSKKTQNLPDGSLECVGCNICKSKLLRKLTPGLLQILRLNQL
ncbi:Tetratricopeptide-like helical [Artemisia annua]|uniref:Tetratricopeptide-like helical n=1 Tax=Artemisia annua TaxID=35608 RepID=A0A2U1L588_ARTAN|nr:Tetratricopeptide-like helical [Artemisia annua]